MSIIAICEPKNCITCDSSVCLNQPRDYGEFGSAITAVGGYVVVGASEDNSSGVSAAGAAYEFKASSGSLINSFQSLNAQERGGFGTSVSMNGGLIVVGAPDETVDGTINAGRAYIV